MPFRACPVPQLAIRIVSPRKNFPFRIQGKAVPSIGSDIGYMPMPITCTGVRLSSIVDPSPNCPYRLFPHVHAVPSDSRARLWIYPPCIFDTLLSPLTNTGQVRCCLCLIHFRVVHRSCFPMPKWYHLMTVWRGCDRLHRQ